MSALRETLHLAPLHNFSKKPNGIIKLLNTLSNERENGGILGANKVTWSRNCSGY